MQLLHICQDALNLSSPTTFYSGGAAWGNFLPASIRSIPPGLHFALLLLLFFFFFFFFFFFLGISL
jgi:hypothetical protein